MCIIGTPLGMAFVLAGDAMLVQRSMLNKAVSRRTHTLLPRLVSYLWYHVRKAHMILQTLN